MNTKNGHAKVHLTDTVQVSIQFMFLFKDTLH